MPADYAKPGSPVAEHDARLERALARLHDPDNTATMTKIADEEGVRLSTLSDRHNRKTKSRIESWGTYQKLAPEVEDALHGFVTAASGRRAPLSKQQIIAAANAYLRQQTGLEYAAVGERWVSGFASRFGDLKSVMASKSKPSELVCHTPEAAKQFFDALDYVIHEHKIPLRHIYNMDETSFRLCEVARGRRWVSTANNPRGKVESLQPHDNITVIECIKNDNRNHLPMPAYVIFKDSHGSAAYNDDATDEQYDELYFVRESAGWQTAAGMTEWLDLFDKYTAPSNPDTWRLLLLDQAPQHKSIDFAVMAHERKIVPMLLPANTTSWLQPLDVAVFQPLKAQYQVWLQEAGYDADKVPLRAFLTDYSSKIRPSITAAVVRSAFDKIGIESRSIDRRVVMAQFEPEPEPAPAPDTAPRTPSPPPVTPMVFTPSSLEEDLNLRRSIFADVHGKSLEIRKHNKWVNSREAVICALQNENNLLRRQLQTSGHKIKRRQVMPKSGFMQLLPQQWAKASAAAAAKRKKPAPPRRLSALSPTKPLNDITNRQDYPQATSSKVTLPALDEDDDVENAYHAPEAYHAITETQVEIDPAVLFSIDAEVFERWSEDVPGSPQPWEARL